MTIFKIQRSLETTEPVPQVLVYDRKRGRFGQLPLTPDVEKLFGDRVKLFVYGTQDENGVVTISGIAPWQVW